MSSDDEKRSGHSDQVEVYTFKVTYLGARGVWRLIEIAADQSLDDLHAAIQHAVDFDFDHLYSFFLSGRAWDEDSEYVSPGSEGRSAARVKVRDLHLQVNQRFLYLFDYGDEHRFDVQLVSINPAAPKGAYPRVLERHGKNPPQYPEWENEEDEEDWEGEDDEEEMWDDEAEMWDDEEEWDEEDNE